MPTGYTSRIKDDSTLADFALDCAKGFIMHDFSIDAPIPEFEPFSYFREQLDEATAELKAAEDWTLDDAAAAMAKHNAEMEGYRQRLLSESNQLRNRYERMREMVLAWQPKPEHEALKAYMLEQISVSLESDCHSEEFVARCYVTVSDTPEQYRANVIAARTRAVVRSREGLEDEIDRTNKRNAWVKALRESLMEPATA